MERRPPEISVVPIGHVAGGRASLDDDDWGEVASRIVLADGIDSEALVGLEAFSHVEVLFAFDRVDPAKVVQGVRHPRGNPDWPRVGIFAQRAKARPNRLGNTMCRLVSVGPRWIEVQGLDAIDGTPVLDLKPVLREFLPREPVTQPAWATELMRGYW